jgi:hypothetical protein
MLRRFKKQDIPEAEGMYTLIAVSFPSNRSALLSKDRSATFTWSNSKNPVLSASKWLSEFLFVNWELSGCGNSGNIAKSDFETMEMLIPYREGMSKFFRPVIGFW